MGNPDDIHSYDTRYNTALQKLDRIEISERNRALIKDFIKTCRKEGIKKGSCSTYLSTLIRMALFYKDGKKDLDQITEDDFDELLEYLESQGLKNFSYCKIIKKLFSWKTDGEPPRWIRKMRLIRGDTPVQPSDLLTQAELDLLLNTYTHPRGKAFAAVTLDSCQRVGAIGTLRVKSVEQNAHGALIYLSTTSRNLKTTQPKPIPLTWSAGYLNQWLSIHPLRDDPEAPLWINLRGDTKYEAMSYSALRRELLKVAEEAGLKKKVHFHLFKHIKVTRMIEEGFSDQQIKYQAGWTPNSTRMFTIYGNFLGRDMVNSILKKHGLEVEEKKMVTLKQCPRCHVPLVPEAKVCHQCGLVLDSGISKEIDATAQLEEKVLARLLENPEAIVLLKDRLSKVK